MATAEQTNSQHLNLGLDSQYPSALGVYCAAIAFKESVEGTNLTDKLDLSGTLLVFPEFSAHKTNLQHIITLGHQIDHYYDSCPIDNSKALRNFNSLYPKLLKEQYGQDNLLVKSLLGFISQAMIIEKQAHQSFERLSNTDTSLYRELINAVWVRMIVSLGTRLLGGNNDPISFGCYKNTNEIYDAYKSYIERAETSNIPGGEKSYTLFLWTMAIQEKYDSISKLRNSMEKNPYMEKSNKDYANLAIQAGVNPLVLYGTLKSIELLPYLQRLQRF